MEILIYKISGCGYCQKIEELMARANVEYQSFVVGKDITRDEFKKQYPSATAYPYTIIDGVPIGGLVETVKFFVEKGLVKSNKNSN